MNDIIETTVTPMMYFPLGNGIWEAKRGVLASIGTSREKIERTEKVGFVIVATLQETTEEESDTSVGFFGPEDFEVRRKFFKVIK